MYKLIVKSQDNWKSQLSGDLNKLNTFCLFETDNPYGFPVVKSSTSDLPEQLIDFKVSKKKLMGNSSSYVHFFIDDYYFESIWSNPLKYAELFKFYDGVISPTFSIWSNQPKALNIFNVYRSRWCTRFFQEQGINVIPDVRWADESTYDYCFSGIKKHSVLALNTVGTKRLVNRDLFIKGFSAMMKALEPSALLVYGEFMPVDFDNLGIPVKYYDSYWKIRREQLGGK